jgi:hypothetical protein
VNRDLIHLGHVGDRSRRQRDQAPGTRVRKAGQAASDLRIVARLTVLTIDVKIARAAGQIRTPLNDVNIAVNVQNESANASVAGTAMETENGIESTGSANETLNGIGTDASVSGTATGKGTVTVTANEVTGTDEMKRTAIGRAGKNARSAVERCYLLKTVANPLVWDIAPPSPQRIHSGSEEDRPMMTYVSLLHGASCRTQ